MYCTSFTGNIYEELYFKRDSNHKKCKQKHSQLYCHKSES